MRPLLSIPLSVRRRRSGAASITIKEVAAQAGVSVATVSRVFNNLGPVREATSRRVRDAAQHLHYVPHPVARSLSIRKTTTIGVLLPELHGEFFSEVIRGIDVAARGRGYHLLVSGSHSDQREMIAVLMAVRGRVDGLIVMSPDLEPAALCRQAGMPVVLLNCRTTNTPSITIANRAGAVAMMNHLASLGHVRIAFIKGPDTNSDAVERLRGYRSAMRRIGPPTARLVEIDGDFSEQSGYAAGERLSGLHPRPTAVFAANDAMAIGALAALRSAGVTVPEDIALGGFDDIPIARYIAPPLTTVSVAIDELGRRAFDLVIDAIETTGDGQRRVETLPAKLIIRESCGAHLAAKKIRRPRSRARRS